jgi:hypothetical protein
VQDRSANLVGSCTPGEVVEPLEIFDGFLVFEPLKGAEHSIAVDDTRNPPARVGEAESSNQISRRYPSGLQCFGARGEACRFGSFLDITPCSPALQLCSMALNVRSCLKRGLDDAGGGL